MTVADGVTAVCLAGAVIICAISGIAVVVMPGFYDKLHFLAPPAVLASLAVTVAVLIHEGFSSTGLKMLIILLVMMIGNPLVTYAAARAKTVVDRKRDR